MGPQALPPASAAPSRGVAAALPRPPVCPPAGARSPVLCFPCASINRRGPRASPLLGLWEGRWARHGTAGQASPKGPQTSPQGAGLGKQSHVSGVDGALELPHTSQEGETEASQGRTYSNLEGRRRPPGPPVGSLSHRGGGVRSRGR